MESVDLAKLSELWGRRFIRAGRIYAAANVTIELIELQDAVEQQRFLRLYRPNGWTECEIKFELDVLRAIAPDPDMKVATPIPGSDGALIKRMAWDSTVRQACLFEAAQGRPFAAAQADLFHHGKGLAALHNQLQNISLAKQRQIEVASLLKNAAYWLRQAGPEAAEIAAAIDRVSSALDVFLSKANLATGVIHGDANLLNAHLDGERVTFFDFDECVYGPIALDFATMAIWLSPADRTELWSALLNGYAARRPLPARDLAVLPAVILLAEIRMAHVLAKFWEMSPELWQGYRKRMDGRIQDFTALL